MSGGSPVWLITFMCTTVIRQVMLVVRHMLVGLLVILPGVTLGSVIPQVWLKERVNMLVVFMGDLPLLRLQEDVIYICGQV